MQWLSGENVDTGLAVDHVPFRAQRRLQVAVVDGQVRPKSRSLAELLDLVLPAHVINELIDERRQRRVGPSVAVLEAVEAGVFGADQVDEGGVGLAVLLNPFGDGVNGLDPVVLADSELVETFVVGAIESVVGAISGAVRGVDSISGALSGSC